MVRFGGLNLNTNVEYPTKRIGMFIAFAIISLAIAMQAYILYQYLQIPSPRFFGLPLSNTPFEINAQTKPNVSSRALLRWATRAVTAIYTMDFVHYEETLDYIRKEYFTANGFDNLYNALQDANFIENIVKNKLALNAVPVEPPIILQSGLIDGQEAWQIGIKLLVNYQTIGRPDRQERKVIVLLVTRVPTSETLQGIGITQFLASDA